MYAVSGQKSNKKPQKNGHYIRYVSHIAAALGFLYFALPQCLSVFLVLSK